jgi:hypothetical protein
MTVLSFMFVAFKANLDLSSEYNILFMDELISYREIFDILNAESFSNLFDQITDGGDHRYGRIIYNLGALVSYLPSKIWGEQGQIISYRFLLVVLIAISAISLSSLFIKNNWLRALSILAILSLPTTSYYAHMPKPEPFILLFLTCFLYFYIKQKFHLGWYFVFLGLAFASKISVLFLIPYFFILSYLNRKPLTNPIKDRQVIRAGIFFFLGYMIGEPILLQIPFAGPIQPVKSYLSWTFLSTGHGTDDTSINFWSWLEFLFFDYFNVHFVVIVLFFVLVLIGAFLLNIFSFGKLVEQDSKNIRLTLGISLLLTLPIMLKANRLWDFYLHLGGVFMILTSIALIQQLFHKNRKQIAIAIIAIIVIGIGFETSENLKEYNHLANRTNTVEHKQKYEEHQFLKACLKTIYSKSEAKKGKVLMDPNLYIIEDNENLATEQFWGPISPANWNQGYDIIITYKSRGSGLILPESQTSKQYDKIQESIYAIKKNALDPNGKYKLYQDHPVSDRVDIFLKKDIEPCS